MPVNGGVGTKVIDSIDRSNFTSNFAVANTGIYFVREGDKGLSLQFFNLATARVRKIMELERTLYNGITVTPDGLSVLYSKRDWADSDLMLNRKHPVKSSLQGLF